MSEFKITEINIPHISYFDENRIGVLKVQMPEQCQQNGLCKIKKEERKSNVQIVKAVLSKCSTRVFSKGHPHFIVFPELSVSMEAAQLIITKLRKGEINNNTIVIFGLEHVTKEEFLSLLKDSDSCDHFNENLFGQNIRLVNTAVVLIRDNVGRNHIYYQPKISRSRYEHRWQFASEQLYIFCLGTHKIMIAICSDFVLERDNAPILATLLQAADKYYTNPRHEKIDLIFLLQKNKVPLGSLYTKIIKMLYFREHHTINTSQTIICSVNNISIENMKYFRNSNVSVMNRGRPPYTLKDSIAEPFYAWKSLEKEAGEQDSLHYVLWRLRYPGVISFILNTDDRPSRIQREAFTPIEEPALEKFDDNFKLTRIEHVPETYEFKEILLDDFSSFVERLFLRELLKEYFGNIAFYEKLFRNLFKERPCDIIRTLLHLHEENSKAINCDLWEKNKEIFKYFFVSLAMLSTNYEDLETDGDKFKGYNNSISIIDCDNMRDLQFREQKGNLLLSPCGATQIILLQRLRSLFRNWDGKPKRLNELLNGIKITKVHGRLGNAFLTTKTEYPYILTLCHLINKLNARQSYDNTVQIKEILNDCFQCV